MEHRKGPLTSRPRGGALTALALLGLAAALAAASIASPTAITDSDLGYVAQGIAQAIAGIACLRAAIATEGLGRLAWALLSAGQVMFSLTNLVFAAVEAAGVTVPEVSAFDVLWLAYYLPTLAAVALLYRRMRPEPGWVGAVDALILTSSLALTLWVWALTPLAATGAGGIEGTAINSLYPTLDLLGLSVVGWLVLRRGGSPRWMISMTAFFLVSVVADVFYLRGALLDRPGAVGASAALYVVAAVLLMFSADRRRRASEEGLDQYALRGQPPAWTQILPFVLVAPLLVMLTDSDHDPVVDILAVLVIAVVIGRLSWTVLRLAHVARENELLLVTDPLTGATNRRFLAEEIIRLASRSRRDGSTLAVIMLDLDGFKQVNDTLGHATGDLVLIRVVAEMRPRLRGGDVLCRMGGDEFVILLPGTDEDGAINLTERLTQGIAAAREAVCPDVALGGSFGTAAQSGIEVDAEELLRRADAAMYSAKRAGGARTVPWRQGTAARIGLAGRISG